MLRLGEPRTICDALYRLDYTVLGLASLLLGQVVIMSLILYFRMVLSLCPNDLLLISATCLNHKSLGAFSA